MLHYAFVFVDGRAMAFAYVAEVKSTDDHSGRSGDPATRFGSDRFNRADGVRYNEPAGAMEAVLGTLETEASHFILFDREPFSQQRWLPIFPSLDAPMNAKRKAFSQLLRQSWEGRVFQLMA